MERLRIDKWLWAARFYKTRSLASQEVDKGRVLLNGQATKPAREVKPGDQLQITVSHVTRTLDIRALSAQRGSAPMAALLFTETPQSIARRVQAAELHRLAPEPALSLTQGRPTKRERRLGEKIRQPHLHA